MVEKNTCMSRFSNYLQLKLTVPTLSINRILLLNHLWPNKQLGNNFESLFALRVFPRFTVQPLTHTVKECLEYGVFKLI